MYFDAVSALSFGIAVIGSSGSQLTYTSNTESLFVNLECCTQYSYQVVARANAGHEASSEWFHFMTYGLSEGELGLLSCSGLILLCSTANQDDIPMLVNIFRNSPAAVRLEISNLRDRIVEISFYTHVEQVKDTVIT